jgi:hypothetical protein
MIRVPRPSPKTRAALSRAWPHVRAALVLFHVASMVILATPAQQGGLSRRAWKARSVQSEMALWSRRLTAWGFALSPAEVEERAYRLMEGWMGVREIVTAPFGRYARSVGAVQSWSMFTGPQIYPTVLVVDVERGGVWEPVFARGSKTLTWQGAVLDHARLRKMFVWFNSPGRDRAYGELVDWLAARAAHDFKDATRLRARLYRYQQSTPEEARAGVVHEGTVERERIVPLDGLR